MTIMTLSLLKPARKSIAIIIIVIIMGDLRVSALDLQCVSSSRFLRSQVQILAKRTKIKFIGKDLLRRAMFSLVEV
jgi:hypothetical protein